MSSSVDGIDSAAVCAAQMRDSLVESNTKREKVSAFVVCFNEEREIQACLETLQFCDEIVVIDSFSSDSTVAICESLGAKVIQRAWPGYKEQKAYGLSATTHEWVLNLDADERVSPQLQESILAVLRDEYRAAQEKSTKQRPNGYEISRVVHYLGRWWRKGGWYPEYRVRFMRKSATVWGGVDPHERPIVKGEIKRLDGELEHYTYRSMADQVLRLHSHASIAAEQEFRERPEAMGFAKLVLNPLARSFKFYVLKKGYREGTAGFIVAVLEGFYTFIKYAKVWELQNTAGGSNNEE